MINGLWQKNADRCSVRFKKQNTLSYQTLEARFMLTALDWVDAAGNILGDNDIPNRTDITARLITSQSLPDTLTASIYEDDALFNDYVTDIELYRIAQDTWTGAWQATWTDDGVGVPEYFFSVAGVSGSSNNIDVIQGNGWHVQANVAGALSVGSQINSEIQPSQFPAGLNLDQLAIEIDFGSPQFANGQHAFDLVIASPDSLWNETILVEADFDFSNPVVEIFRTAGCVQDCTGNDFSSYFLFDGLNNGFYGNWSLTANNLEAGDSITIDNFRTTFTFHSKLHVTGYDANLEPSDPYTGFNREYGFISDFNNVEITERDGTTKAAIFIHGWNPGEDGLGDSFQENYGGEFWNPLKQYFSEAVDVTSEWLVGAYDWVNDAATGSIIDVVETLAKPPLSSRDVGTAHGAFLGRALFGIEESLFSQLDSVQLIAHSAGNWVALEAAAYLRAAGFDGQLQLTSLDAFVSNVNLGIGIEAERIFEAGADSFQLPSDILENYYVNDFVTDGFGGWTSGDYVGWTINRQLDASLNNAPLYDGAFNEHGGPIGWYAETAGYLLNGGDLNLLEENGIPLGFGSSLLYADWQMVQPRVLRIDPVDGGPMVMRDANVTIDFSEQMDSETLNSSSVQIVGSVSGLHDGDYQYSGTTLIVDPYTDFDAGETVTILVTRDVLTSDGRRVARPYISSFTAINSTPTPIPVGGTLSNSTTWSTGNVYLVTSDLTIPSGIVLQVEPGVVVKFLVSSSSRDLIVDGTLDLQSTASQKIVFTSSRDDLYGGDSNGDGSATTPSTSNWGGIKYTNSDNVLHDTLIRYGGAESFGLVWAADTSGTLEIRDNVIEKAYSYAIYVAGDVTIEGNTISDSPWGVRLINSFSGSASLIGNVLTGNTYPVYQGGGDLFYSGNNFSGNTNSVIAVAGSLVDGVVWENVQGLGMPYLATSDVTVPDSTTLTIKPGIVVKFLVSSSSRDLIVDGTLDLQSTASQKIVFTSSRDDLYGGDSNGDGSATTPSTSNWGGIKYTNSDNVLHDTLIRYGGAESFGLVWAADTSGTLEIRDNVIEKAYSYAIYVAGDVTIEGNTISDSPWGVRLINSFSGSASLIGNVLTGNTYPVYQGGGDLFYSGNNFSGNTNSVIAVAGSLVDGVVWENVQGLGMPYLATSDVTVPDSTTLTIKPGIVVKFLVSSSSRDLIVDGTLDLQSTASQKIVFTSSRDDLYGGDSNGDGSATTPSTSNWGGIKYTNSDNVLHDTLIRYGGAESFGLVWAADTSGTLEIRDNVIEKAYSYAIYVAGDVTIEGNTISDSPWGVRLINSFSGSASLIGNVLTGNTYPVYQGGGDLFYSGNNFSGNTNSVIAVAGSLVDGVVWENVQGLGMPYLATSDVTVPDSTTLTIKPGIVVKFDATRKLTIQGTYIGPNTGGNPAVFTSYRDDTYGGDSNGDGPSTPNRADWAGIFFETTDNVFAQASVRYAGVNIAGPAITIRNVDFEFTPNPAARIQNGGIGTTIHNVNFYDWLGNGVQNDTFETIDARNNYWGDPSGPSGVGPGSGAGVTNNVLYDPWLAMPAVGDSGSSNVTIDGVTINNGSINRSGLGTIAISFTKAVIVNDETALRIYNQTNGQPIDISSALISGEETEEVTWDLSGITFPTGWYTAELINTDVHDLGGIPMSVSYTFELHVRRGDLDGDTKVAFSDYNQVGANFDPIAGIPYRDGDADGDGKVAFSDYNTVGANFDPIALPELEYDFGDATETDTSFPTTLANNGARHVLGSDTYLGTAVDNETDGQPNSASDGDGSDEDGVSFGLLTVGEVASIDVTSNLPRTGFLNAWVDFNQDGDWDDAGERIFDNLPIVNGVQQLRFNIPAEALVGNANSRFRVTESRGYSYFGLAPNGEVEDYLVSIASASGSFGILIGGNREELRGVGFDWLVRRDSSVQNNNSSVDRFFADLPKRIRRSQLGGNRQPVVDSRSSSEWYKNEDERLRGVISEKDNNDWIDEESDQLFSFGDDFDDQLLGPNRPSRHHHV